MINRKLSMIGLSFGLAFLFLFSSSVSEVWAACSREGCNGLNPYTSGCSSNSSIMYSAPIVLNGKTIGTNYLHYSWSCHTAWAYAAINNPAPYNSYVNAGVVRSDGTAIYCAATNLGGNGSIDKNQTTCFSGQLFDQDPYTSYARAEVKDSSNTWHWTGKTASY